MLCERFVGLLLNLKRKISRFIDSQRLSVTAIGICESQTIMMEYSGIIAWLITLAYLSRSGCHVLGHMDNGSVCPPRTMYNMELLSSLVGVEKVIRDAVHSVTE